MYFSGADYNNDRLIVNAGSIVDATF